MKLEYKEKIDKWIESRTDEELDHTIDSAHKEFLKRNRETVDKINQNQTNEKD